MKRFIFRFTAQTPKGNYETYAPADHYIEAYDVLKRNAVKTTGVPVECWTVTHCTEQV